MYRYRYRYSVYLPVPCQTSSINLSDILPMYILNLYLCKFRSEALQVGSRIGPAMNLHRYKFSSAIYLHCPYSTRIVLWYPPCSTVATSHGCVSRNLVRYIGACKATTILCRLHPVHFLVSTRTCTVLVSQVYLCY